MPGSYVPAAAILFEQNRQAEPSGMTVRHDRQAEPSGMTVRQNR